MYVVKFLSSAFTNRHLYYSMAADAESVFHIVSSYCPGTLLKYNICVFMQTAFLALHMKRQHNQKDSHFEEECNLQHSVRLPQPNNHPTSLHIIKRLLDCREVHDVEQHVCVNDCCKFNKLQPREYRQHKHQACPTCGEGRFKVKSTSRE